MTRAVPAAVGLAAIAIFSAGCGGDEWDSLRREVLVRHFVGDKAGATRTAEGLLNVADSDFPDDWERVLTSLRMLSSLYREQKTLRQGGARATPGVETVVQPDATTKPTRPRPAPRRFENDSATPPDRN